VTTARGRGTGRAAWSGFHCQSSMQPPALRPSGCLRRITPFRVRPAPPRHLAIPFPDLGSTHELAQRFRDADRRPDPTSSPGACAAQPPAPGDVPILGGLPQLAGPCAAAEPLLDEGGDHVLRRHRRPPAGQLRGPFPGACGSPMPANLPGPPPVTPAGSAPIRPRGARARPIAVQRPPRAGCGPQPPARPHSPGPPFPG